MEGYPRYSWAAGAHGYLSHAPGLGDPFELFRLQQEQLVSLVGHGALGAFEE